MAKFGQRKFAYIFGIVCLFILFVIVFAPKALAVPANTYFSVSGGDVYVGGWFNSPDQCLNSDPNYQAPTDPTGSNNEGAILTFANPTSRISSTDMGVFATGTIQADTTNGYGFYSGPSSGSNYALGFASPANPNTAWGGFFDGATTQTHCIYDYFDTKQNGGAYSWSSGTTPATAFPVQYYVDATGNTFKPGGGVIPAGQDTTIFVKGNVYLDTDITYAAHNSTNIPKFAIIALGDIYISPAVSQLDGLYIAQPNMGDLDPANDDTGVIWTCHDKGTNAAPTQSWAANNCATNKLTVNGAFIAKAVELTRVQDATSKSLEKFNYTPEMVLGGGFFNPLPDPSLNIDSVISLPAVF